MYALSERGLNHAWQSYSKWEAFFPLVAAVLSGAQAGVAFGDDPDKPSQVYAEHHFGFSQVFGPSHAGFEADLERYLLDEKAFGIPKVRLYAPTLLPFQKREEMKRVESWRQRFFLDQQAYAEVRAKLSLDHTSWQSTRVKASDLSDIEEQFGLLGRFWPDAGSFEEHAHAHLLRCDGKAAAICYAAALENAKAEIDVLTLPEYRGKGYAIRVVADFVDECLALGIEPLWDCFTNNAGSMALRARMGFLQCGQLYPFYTLVR